MTHLNSEQTNPWASRPQEPTTTDPDTDAAFRDDATVVGYDAMILPTSTPPPTTQVEPTRPPQMQDDLASLKSIFPDFDDAVILSVLESTDGDHDRALDMLLGMNDPSFVPPNPPQPAPVRDAVQQYSAPSTEQRLSQEALDEQFARQLALEEQQNASQTAQWHHPTAAEGRVGYQPYQRRRNGWDAPQGQGQGQGKDTMTEVQEGFNRIAESGKKTFSSIVSKVRAKMQEMDQGQGWSWYQGSSNQPPQSGPAASSSYTPAPQGPQAQPYQPQGPQRQQSRTSTFATPPRSGVTRPEPGTVPVPAQHQPSYYDPNTRGYDLYGDDDDDEPIHIDIPAPLTATTTTTTATQPHVPTDVSPQEPSSPSHPFSLRSTSPGRLESRAFAGGTGTTTTTATTATATTTAPQPATPDASSPPSSEASSLPSYATARSTTPNASSGSPARSQSPAAAAAAGGKVDFSKLGLLPKRPISLVRPQSPAAAGAPRVAPAHSQSSDSSGEPEFVENPFEDPR